MAGPTAGSETCHPQPLAACGMHVQNRAQMLPASPETPTQSTRGFSKGDRIGASGTDWLQDAATGSPEAVDGEAGVSSGDAPSLPPSIASHCPGGINTHFRPLISSRGAGGGKKKKSLERKTHFLQQKKKIKSGLIKVNFTGERRERAKHNVLEISSARLRPRKQDKAASAVSAGMRRRGG